METRKPDENWQYTFPPEGTYVVDIEYENTLNSHKPDRKPVWSRTYAIAHRTTIDGDPYWRIPNFENWQDGGGGYHIIRWFPVNLDTSTISDNWRDRNTE